MPTAVSDSRSNSNDQIAHAAKVIGRSPPRRKVFKAVYHGKQKLKTVSEVVRVTRLTRKAVLTEAKKLVNQHIMSQTRKDGEIAYEKDNFYHQNKATIVRLATSKANLKAYPTKYSTGARTTLKTTIRISGPKVRVRQITIDDIDGFSKVRRVKADPTPTRISESHFKSGIKQILGETGKFQDWGGEKNDLLTTRVKVKGTRRPTAFAFKGPGKKGILVPGAMGKNGDQIQRLFSSPAEIFIVQYWKQIADSVLEQMHEFAKAKSATEGKEICFGVVDGQDSNRLLMAYPKAFKR